MVSDVLAARLGSARSLKYLAREGGGGTLPTRAEATSNGHTVERERCAQAAFFFFFCWTVVVFY